MDRVPLVVLASGTGTLLQAVLDASSEFDYPAEVVGFVSDKPGCGAVRRAAGNHVPVSMVDPAEFDDREAWNAALGDAVAAFHPEWVVCLGFMRLLSGEFLGRFPGKVLNTHPSLLPSFTGARAVAQAIDYGVHVTGCTVHVVDEGVDSGPILAQVPVAVRHEDSVETLHHRIKSVERTLIVDVVAHVAVDGYELDGRRVTLS